ncbi:MAG: hypothetical protein M1607_01380 [Patescibacteria group bacterium]|nr:hypothetical protein [Patescibacteria group bacterium]
MAERPDYFDPNEEIDVAWKFKDFLVLQVAMQRGDITPVDAVRTPQLTVLSITRKQIAEFCSTCDFYRGSLPCRLVGLDDQTRYVARQWCGWASSQGQNGQMSYEGFKS